jgi:hypothetical protein
MNCQYCGTELASKRAKNCPDCTAILNDANRKGAYAFVLEAAATAKNDGLTGESVQATMRSALKAGQAKRAEWAAEYRQRVEDRKQADACRTRFYQEHGYWPGEGKGDLEDTRKDIEAGENFKRNPGAEPEIYG